LQLFQNICYLDLHEGEPGRLVHVVAGGVELLPGVGGARKKAWPAIEMLIEILDYRGFIGVDSVS
jgi:hypothetical protein